MAWKNTLAYFVPSVYRRTVLLFLTGVKVMKLFYFVTETADKQARVFVLGTFFIIFKNQAHTQIVKYQRLWPYSQIIDLPEKVKTH
jgi:hypothetical protein